jgi:arylsulfatase A-like enzyme
MNRIPKPLLLLLTACLLLVSFTVPAAPNSLVRPNFVFLLIDDMGYADMSCYGSKAVRTANLDRLAGEGLRFTQFCVASPICSPSRTGFTTGQYPARWRITSYLAERRENERRGMAQWLDPSAPTLARLLHQAGYATGHFGKWHMGGQRDVGEAPLITEYGFDKSLTQFEGLGDRLLPLCDACDGKPPRQYALGSDRLGRGHITWLNRSTITGAFITNALRFIEESKMAGKPFYVNIWPDDVHSPFFPPCDLRGDSSKRQLYLGVVKAMDQQFARLFDYLRNDPQLRTNTILIVASDNGPEPGAGEAGPLRGHKGNLYEGGFREPFIVWAPGFMDDSARGKVNERSVISGVDLLPSLARLAGVALPAGVVFDGEDFSQTFLGRETKLRSRPLFWNRPPDRPGPVNDRFPDLAVRDGDWKLLMMEDGARPQLYNLATDPGESHNLAAAQSAVVERLSRELLAWRKSVVLTFQVR